MLYHDAIIMHTKNLPAMKSTTGKSRKKRAVVEKGERNM